MHVTYVSPPFITINRTSKNMIQSFSSTSSTTIISFATYNANNYLVCKSYSTLKICALAYLIWNETNFSWFWINFNDAKKITKFSSPYFINVATFISFPFFLKFMYWFDVCQIEQIICDRLVMVWKWGCHTFIMQQGHQPFFEL